VIAAILRGSALSLAVAPCLGCPHAIYAIPTLLHEAPRFPGAAPAAADPKFVPIALDLATEGHFIVYRLRVDGTNLEPTSGPCRRWFLVRGARVAGAEPRTFCGDDDVRFRVAAGTPHSVELLIGSEHTVAKRVVLEPGESLRWRMPIKTQRVELSITPDARESYTLRGGEEVLRLGSALGSQAQAETRFERDARPRYYKGVEVGAMRIGILRDRDRRVVSEVSVPLYSGRLGCEPPFCEAP
jgi:hypothetical protein